jgi:hypothetical protein
MDVSLLIGVLSSTAHPVGGPLSFSYTLVVAALGMLRATADEATARTAERVLTRSIVPDVQKQEYDDNAERGGARDGARYIPGD